MKNYQKKDFKNPKPSRKNAFSTYMQHLLREKQVLFFAADSLHLSNTAATDYLINDCTAIITGAELVLMLLAPAVPLLQSRVNRRDEKRSHGSSTLGYDLKKKKRFWVIYLK